MEPLLLIYCPLCDLIDEAALSSSGPHIKASCGTCNRYIRFVNKHTLPDILDVRTRIWEITGGNIKTIEELKKGVNFDNQFLGYWNVYIKLIKAGKNGTHDKSK